MDKKLELMRMQAIFSLAQGRDPWPETYTREDIEKIFKANIDLMDVDNPSFYTNVIEIIEETQDLFILYSTHFRMLLEGNPVSEINKEFLRIFSDYRNIKLKELKIGSAMFDVYELPFLDEEETKTYKEIYENKENRQQKLSEFFNSLGRGVFTVEENPDNPIGLSFSYIITRKDKKVKA